MNVRYWSAHPGIFLRRVWHFAYERIHPDEPFLAPAAVRFLDRELPRDGLGLEWGSGRSTPWFASRLKRLVAVEHDEAWAKDIRSRLAKAGVTNVDYRVIPLDHDPSLPTTPHYDPMPRYVSFVEEFPDASFDYIEVDGHYRQACAAVGLAKLKPGGLVLIDDTSWIPIEEWGVPSHWPIVHQSVKINTVTSIWRRPR